MPLTLPGMVSLTVQTKLGIIVAHALMNSLIKQNTSLEIYTISEVNMS